MDQGGKTALGGAKERFLAGLGRRLSELEPSIRAVRTEPRSPFAQADLQRRLHALLASAQLFEQLELSAVLQRATSRLDAVALGMAEWSEENERSLSAVVDELRRLSGEEEPRPEARPRGARLGRTLPPIAAMPAVVVPPPPLAQTKKQLLEAASSGQAKAAMLVRVLLVCSRPHAAELRAVLDDAPLQLLHAADPEQALVLLHMAAPACAFVAAEFATLPDIDLVRRLQTDPLSRLDGVYLLLPAGASYDAEFLRQTGADGVLVEPLSLETLVPVIERATRRRGRGGLRALRSQSEGTVDEIASFVAEEIRSGISESLRAGLHERIRLGDAGELADLAKSTITRVRAHLSEQSQGRVQFGMERANAAAALERAEHAATEGVQASPEPAVKLHGTRVLVVDDDPAVLWFFAGLLREAGADVLQAQDGREALEIARRKRPHVVLSDILMPKVDGFALSRELKRDALLEHVPLILLSWKEDLLERMRELDAGASGYLRKEASSAEVLSAVAEVLAARLQLTAALREPGEVAGRVEEMGIVPLLESVASARPDARINVQDAWNLFEIDVRAGQRLAVTRTAADGSFARGERALVQLLGVNAGRFSVVHSQLVLRGALDDSFASALDKAGKTSAGVTAAVSDTRLVHIARLSFDEEVLELLLSCTPTRLHEVVERFRQDDASVQQLLLEGAFTPAELESHLRELARRGAITGVWNAQGDDLLEAALREREQEPGSMLRASSPHANSAWFSSLSQGERANAQDALDDDLTPVELPSRQMELRALHNDQPARPLAASEASDSSLPAPRPVTSTNPVEIVRAVEAARQESSRRERLRLIVTLAALAALGYIGQRFVASGGEFTTTFNALVARRSAASAPRPAATSPVVEERRVEGETLPYIDVARGVSVEPDQGLLVIEYAGAAPAPRVSIDGRDLGAAPIAVALSAAQHELTVQAGVEFAQRALVVRAGETRVLTLPFAPAD